MQGTTAHTHLIGIRPINIAALMELLERNYRLVEQLLPELDAPFESATSHASGEPDLHLEIVDREKFTLGLRLGYELGDGGRKPDFHIRVYLDARVAEATDEPVRPRWQARDEDDPEAMRYLGRQWDLNLMLHKWLTYLLDCGHGFEMAERPRVGNYPV